MSYFEGLVLPAEFANKIGERFPIALYGHPAL